MAKTVVKFKLDPIDTKRLVDSTYVEIGKKLKELIYASVSRGVSSVMGQGKLKKYKDVNKYPANVMDDFPGKTKSPANLVLSGKMLDSIITKRYGEKSIEVNIDDSAVNDNNTKVYVYAAAHNFGEGNMPERPFLPRKGRGETFNATIMRKIVDIFNNRLKNIIK
jgi:phage gpG-like protein